MRDCPLVAILGCCTQAECPSQYGSLQCFCQGEELEKLDSVVGWNFRATLLAKVTWQSLAWVSPIKLPSSLEDDFHHNFMGRRWIRMEKRGQLKSPEKQPAARDCRLGILRTQYLRGPWVCLYGRRPEALLLWSFSLSHVSRHRKEDRSEHIYWVS